ncbi:MAG TPA: hypothetical protein VGE42_07000 [Candidatus Dormibacteraeota bacterium]
MSRRTTRPAERVLADIARLDVPGATVVARGATHLVLAPGPAPRYGAGAAVTAGVAVTLGVLIASASSVALIALLPTALLWGLPLLLRRDPRVAVGAVEDDGATAVTVSGDMWSALAVALHSYLAGLPAPTATDGSAPPAPRPPAAPVISPATAAPASTPAALPDEFAAS